MSNNEQQKAILEGCEQVMRQLSRLCHSQNISQKDFSEISKKSYLLQLEDDLKDKDQLNFCEIERISGLNRQTAKKLIDEYRSNNEDFTNKPTIYTKVLMYWDKSNEYSRKIPISGDQSFAQLVQDASGGYSRKSAIKHESILHRLIDSRCVKEVSDGYVILVSTIPYFNGLSKDSIKWGISQSLAGHTNTVVSNLLADNSHHRKHEMLMRSNNTSPELKSKLVEFMTERGKETIKLVEQFMVNECESDEEFDEWIGIGSYIVEMPANSD